jgi:hypothetical protein
MGSSSKEFKDELLAAFKNAQGEKERRKEAVRVAELAAAELKASTQSAVSRVMAEAIKPTIEQVAVTLSLQGTGPETIDGAPCASTRSETTPRGGGKCIAAAVRAKDNSLKVTCGIAQHGEHRPFSFPTGTDETDFPHNVESSTVVTFLEERIKKVIAAYVDL